MLIPILIFFFLGIRTNAEKVSFIGSGMDNVAQNWRSLNPIQLSSLLRRKAFIKITEEEIEKIIHEYFEHYHSSLPTQHQIQIGDELSLFACIIETFSNDPIYQLLKCGIVIFSDSICVNFYRMSDFFHIPVKLLIDTMKRANYNHLFSLPQNCYETLLQLGFIDSLDYSMTTVSPADPFFLYIGSHPMIVQPFPLEIIDLLLYAKQDSVQEQQYKMNKYVRSAIKRIELIGKNGSNDSFV